MSESKNFKDFFNEELVEKKEPEIDPKEIELGIEEEKEHKDIYDLLKAWADENKLELPISEEDFILMIVNKHLQENPTYYTNSNDEEIPKEIEEAVKPEAIAMIKSWMSGKKKKKVVKESQEYSPASDRDVQSMIARIREIESAPLIDRKANQAEFSKDMRESPAMVAERLEWLIAGNYGHAEMNKAIQVLQSPRMNRVAALSTLIAQFEWNCPSRMASEAWLKLTPEEQTIFNGKIRDVIREWETENKPKSDQDILKKNAERIRSMPKMSRSSSQNRDDVMLAQ